MNLSRLAGVALFASALGALSGALSDARSEEPAPEQPLQLASLEVSGIAPLEGGFLLVDDELVGSVLFLPGAALEAGGRLDVQLVKLLRKRKSSQPHTPLPRLLAVQDFEDVASDGQRTVWLLGSHEGKGGERRLDREFLVRARWDPQDRELEVRSPQDADGKRGVYTGLVEHLAAGGQEALTRGLNAEGLAWREGRLWIGLRGPLSEGQAVLLGVDEEALFGGGDAPPRFERRRVDLGGGGVRGLCWDARTARLLIVSGPVEDGGDAPYALWSYDLETQALSQLERFEGRAAKPEGVCRRSEGQLALTFERDEPSGSALRLIPSPGPR